MTDADLAAVLAPVERAARPALASVVNCDQCDGTGEEPTYPIWAYSAGAIDSGFHLLCMKTCEKCGGTGRNYTDDDEEE